MKKSQLPKITTLQVILCFMILLFASCKNHDEPAKTPSKAWKNAATGFAVPSQLFPIYSNTEINDVLDGMSRGLAIIANDTHASAIQSIVPFRNEIMATIPNGNDEVTFTDILEMPNHFHIDGVADSSANSMLGDAIDEYYGTTSLFFDVQPNLQPIDIYMHGFNFGGEKRGTLLRIPGINLARQNTTIQQRPVLVIPARKIDLDDDFETPIYGYYWDPIN